MAAENGFKQVVNR